MRNFIIIATLITSISCCQFRNTNLRHQFILKEYQNNESIRLKNIIICANAGELLNNVNIELNRDSITSSFILSLKRLPIEFDYDNINTQCNLDYLKSYRINFRKIDQKELTSFMNNGVCIVPIINYDYPVLRNIYITSTGAVGGGGFSKSLNLELGIMIFKQKKLIYFK